MDGSERLVEIWFWLHMTLSLGLMAAAFLLVPWRDVENRVRNGVVRATMVFSALGMLSLSGLVDPKPYFDGDRPLIHHFSIGVVTLSLTAVALLALYQARRDLKAPVRKIA